MIVEDQPNTAEMLTSYFKPQGYEVSSIGSGEDALTFTDTTVPDLIVLDIRLPDMDGYEGCHQLRAHWRTEHIPVIFLTERRERGAKLLGLELGAVDHVTKPFDVHELHLRARNVLRRASTERFSHPITGLPASPLSDRPLRALLTSTDWAVLSVELVGLKAFSDVYGFVARDNVVRAVALTVNQVVSSVPESDAFVGHLDDTNFVIATTSGKVSQVHQALSTRLKRAMTFFYPRADWEAKQIEGDADWPQLDVMMGVLRAPACPFDNVEDLKEAVLGAQHAD